MANNTVAPAGCKAAFVINNLSGYKAWALQEPNASKLLQEIVYRWRGSTIRARGAAGVWTVYPRDRWVEWTGLSLDQVKRALGKLVLDGFILRERHRFHGTEVRAFIQPTSQALKYVGRPGDEARLKALITPASAPASAPTTAPTSAPTSAPTDYTSLPSLPPEPTDLKIACAIEKEEKGSAGEMEKGLERKKLAPNVTMVSKAPKAPVVVDAPSVVMSEDDEIDAMLAVSKQKALDKALKAYPILKGAHAKFVRHPSEMHPETWVGFSKEVKAIGYAKYKTFVDNWYGAHGGFGAKATSTNDDVSDEDWAKVVDWLNSPDD